jgi:hypothetical protein
LSKHISSPPQLRPPEHLGRGSRLWPAPDLGRQNGATPGKTPKPVARSAAKLPMET